MGYGYEEITISILNNKVALDQECWACDCKSKKPDEMFRRKDGTCSQCNDTGYQLTDAGTAIMDLVKRHSKKLGLGVKLVSDD